MAEIVSLQGTAQVQRARRGPWQSAALGDVLCIGDSLRTGSLSRAALVLADRSILRVDQRTILSLAEEVEERSLLEVFIGIVHFLSQQPRALAVDTPFITAGAEGTEFLVEVSEQRARIAMIKGVVRAANREGEVRITAGEAATARAGEAPRREIVVDARDAVQWAIFYPPILVELAGGGRTPRPLPQALARAAGRVAANDYAGALQALDEVPQAERDARTFTFRAGALLNVGRVEEARQAIDQALALAPDAGEALAQRSIIATAQNQRAQALADARQAVEQSPDSAPARIALSYALQANLELEEAHAVLREAVERAPDDALAWARLAEVELMLGRLDAAEEAAGQAVALAPDLARTQMVQGFAALARIDPDAARAAFERAIALESAGPLLRLGLGLARIRQGDLAEGRREIEIAASLDPSDALIRSYLGKAYFEERRGEDAAEELQLAKTLDPDDPTPWFYDAIRKQTENRPVEALRDLQTSIRLNENRAVYRSRFLLDEDLAARGARLGRIYNDLGFEQLALVEGWKSTAEDPSNHSAHRLLADTYLVLPRHEIARDSELLQSQLLQPLNIDPVQPRLANNGLDFLSDTGPVNASFNEFTRLFAANEPLRLQADAIVGTHDTFADNIIGSGLYNWMSYSLGQFHFQTDGIRTNNDLTQDLYNVFVQAAVTPATSVISELRYVNEEFGDRALLFDLDDFSPDLRINRDVAFARVSGRHSFGPGSTFLASYAYRTFDGRAEDASGRLREEEDHHSIEARQMFHGELLMLDLGLGYLAGDGRADLTDFATATTSESGSDIRHGNGYLYAHLKPFESAVFTMGLSVDSFEDLGLERNEVNPKAGITVRVTEDTAFRAAAFRVLKRNFVSSQTLEPTQVAGFNQFFDDVNGTRIWRYGAGVDHRLSDKLFVGAELSRRDLNIPIVIGATDDIPEVDADELFGRAYAYWTPLDWLALSAEYQFDDFKSDADKLITHRVPLEARIFHSTGAFARLKGTYVNQEVRFPDFQSGASVHDSESFFVLDAALGYRFPNRYGLATIDVRNIFDDGFHFQDVDPSNSRISRERMVLARLTITF